jgi:hypothetical protein
MVGARSKQASGRSEEIDERIRDPPPPANFPGICPKNPKLRNVITRVNRNVFQRNGLHNIPYRDTTIKNQPLPVYDGETWPDSAAVVEVPMVETTDHDVIDIWTQREKEKVLAEETRIKYYDIPHDALKNLIRAIKYPVEIRLLPHIIREWHRQGLPTTLIDASRIARLATRHNEIDVVFQMTNPEVYGLYYDIEGMREVTRGMAKRASMTQGEGEEKFLPEDILRRLPDLLNCSVGTDSKLVLRDPAIMGTQLWGFVSRFNNDETFRTSLFLAEICALTERVIQCFSDTDLNQTLSNQSSSNERHREYAFKVKAQVVDYVPVLYALRQVVKIITSPYRACVSAFQNIQNPDGKTKQVHGYLNSFINSRMSTLEMHPEQSSSSTKIDMNATRAGQWVLLNRDLGISIKQGKVHLPNLTDWQWYLLKQHTVPETAKSTIETKSKSYYLPIRAGAALEILERQMREWKKILKKDRIPVKSEFDMKVVEHWPKS